jgi:tryptophan-rich sensory protein
MKWKTLILAIIICQLAGVIGSVFTFGSITTWYSTLNKPDFTPPSWVFGPVWLALYTMMGISAYLIYESGDKEALKIFSVQLVLNALWSMVFFGLKSPLYALIVIIILFISIFLTILRVYKNDRAAAILLMPYLAWVGFASALNYNILILN